MIKLFIYGTLNVPDVQKKVIGREVPTKTDVLENFVSGVVTINSKAYPIAVKQPGKHLAGAVIDVTENELELIDEYETTAYKRLEVELLSGEKAWVYNKP